MLDIQHNHTVEYREDVIIPPRGLRKVFEHMMELYKRGKPWMLVVCGNDAGVRVHETLPPKWESK